MPCLSQFLADPLNFGDLHPKVKVALCSLSKYALTLTLMFTLHYVYLMNNLRCNGGLLELSVKIIVLYYFIYLLLYLTPNIMNYEDLDPTIFIFRDKNWM